MAINIVLYALFRENRRLMMAGLTGCKAVYHVRPEWSYLFMHSGLEMLAAS